MMPRSYLYVPADQQDRLQKAPTRGADALIVDLEDSVAPGQKQNAREIASEWLQSKPDHKGEIWVRVNQGEDLDSDVEAVIAEPLTGIYLPKASVASLDHLHSLLGTRTVPVTALIETAEGLLTAPEIARHQRVVRLAIGEADLSAELGLSTDEDGPELLPLRMQLILASAAAKIDSPVGPVSTDFKDTDRLRVSTLALKRMGFGGRSAIHPAQVPVINDVFNPSEEEIDRARGIVRAYERATAEGLGAVTGPDGRMIDEAVVRAARKLIDTFSIED